MSCCYLWLRSCRNINTIIYAQKVIGADGLCAVIDGFHLGGADEGTITLIAEELANLGQR